MANQPTAPAAEASACAEPTACCPTPGWLSMMLCMRSPLAHPPHSWLTHGTLITTSSQLPQADAQPAAPVPSSSTPPRPAAPRRAPQQRHEGRRQQPAAQQQGGSTAQQQERPPVPTRVLGIDYGTRWTGLALADNGSCKELEVCRCTPLHQCTHAYTYLRSCAHGGHTCTGARTHARTCTLLHRS